MRSRPWEFQHTTTQLLLLAGDARAEALSPYTERFSSYIVPCSGSAGREQFEQANLWHPFIPSRMSLLYYKRKELVCVTLAHTQKIVFALVEISRARIQGKIFSKVRWRCFRASLMVKNFIKIEEAMVCMLRKACLLKLLKMFSLYCKLLNFELAKCSRQAQT